MVNLWNQRNPEKCAVYRKRWRERHPSELHKWDKLHPAEMKKARKKWIENNPSYLKNYRSTKEFKIKQSARNKVAYALSIGKIKKRACEKCGTKNLIHAHHPDYSNPLQVIWLCQDCHFYVHRTLNLSS